MSIIVPDYLREEKVTADAQAEVQAAESKDERIAKQLPTPTGYKMLIGIPKIEEKFESGILKAEATARNDEVASVVGFVIKQGPDCYKDAEKFPSGPYCKEGDFVLMRTYSGTRFKLHDVEFRLINDDAVECVIEDPRGFSRV